MQLFGKFCVSFKETSFINTLWSNLSQNLWTQSQSWQFLLWNCWWRLDIFWSLNPSSLWYQTQIKITRKALMNSDGDREALHSLIQNSLMFQQQMSILAINSFTSLQNERILNLDLGWLCSVLHPGIMSRWVLPMWASVTPDRFTPPCLLRVIIFCQVLWLSATIMCSSWLGRRLLVSSRSVDPTGMCARQIILALELAPRQPGSCGWLVSLARRLSRGSPVALAEWGAGVLQGARPVCPGTNTLVHLAVWQHRTKDVQKLEWSREKPDWRKTLIDHTWFHTLVPEPPSTCDGYLTACN